MQVHVALIVFSYIVYYFQDWYNCNLQAMKDVLYHVSKRPNWFAALAAWFFQYKAVCSLFVGER